MTFWQAYPWVWWAIFAAVCVIVAGMAAWLLWPVWQQRSHLFGRWRDLEPWDDGWQREPETTADADQLIAEWHTDPPGRAEAPSLALDREARVNPAGGLHRDWARDGFEYECALVWDWARREERLWAELVAETRELCELAA